MKKLRNHLIGIDQGDALMFSDFEDDGEMWTGTGPRRAYKAVQFHQHFKSAPTVHVSLSMWDMDQMTNQRADIRAEDITREGFQLVFRTWGDTRVARARASWLAIGEVPHDDDWDIV